MTLKNINITAYITGKLRNNITDPNSANRASQFGQWIYADKPKIMKLLNSANNFPRISCETISHTTDSEVGMSCTEHIENVSLKINIWTVYNLICTVKSTGAESHGYTTGTDIYELSDLPTSVISLVTGTLNSTPHTFLKGTDYQLMDSDLDGYFDSVEWLGVTLPDNGTNFSVSYQRKASADELCRFIAAEINGYLRDNWRNWSEHVIWDYKNTGGQPVTFDNDISVYRYELTCSFQGINIGESI